MPAFRYYLENPFDTQEVFLIDEEHHHLRKVMRQKEGEEVELVNGLGKLASARIEKIEREGTLLHLEKVVFFPRLYTITLFQAVTLPAHLEWIVEKGGELGMSELTLFNGDRSSGHFSEQKLKRLHTKNISALKQSGRYYLPEIRWVKTLSDLEFTAHSPFFGDLEENAPPLFKALSIDSISTSFSFCSGPEGGFSKREIDFLRKKEVKGIRLHPNILRTETAPITFLSLIHHYLWIQTNTAVVN